MPNTNVWLTKWKATGVNVPVPQYEVNVEVAWTDNEKQPQEWEGAVRFPNVLQDVPVAWVRDEMEDLILRAARKKLNIDGSE